MSSLSEEQVDRMHATRPSSERAFGGVTRWTSFYWLSCEQCPVTLQFEGCVSVVDKGSAGEGEK